MALATTLATALQRICGGNTPDSPPPSPSATQIVDHPPSQQPPPHSTPPPPPLPSHHSPTPSPFAYSLTPSPAPPTPLPVASQLALDSPFVASPPPAAAAAPWSPWSPWSPSLPPPLPETTAVQPRRRLFGAEDGHKGPHWAEELEGVMTQEGAVVPSSGMDNYLQVFRAVRARHKEKTDEEIAAMIQCPDECPLRKSD